MTPAPRTSEAAEPPEPRTVRRKQDLQIPAPFYNDVNIKCGRGFPNHGNTCFMNATLQCLLHCPQIIQLFLVSGQSIVDMGHHLPPKHKTVLEAFANLVNEYWRRQDSYKRPGDVRELLRAFWNSFPQFRRFYQHDAQEFLRTFLDSLSEATGNDMLYSVAFSHLFKPVKDGDDPPPKLKKSPFFDIFGGFIRSEVTCLTCRKKSVTSSPFLELSLGLPTKAQIDKAISERNAAQPPKQGWLSSVSSLLGISNAPLSLDICLHSFCTSENLDQDNVYHCEKCKTKRKARKNLSLVTLPEILVVHVKRFAHGYWSGSTKVSTRVDFPLRGLNMQKFLHSSAQRQTSLYDLIGIVQHSGSTGGGHYIGYCKHPSNDRWFCYNDESVHPVDEKKVASVQAYMLFYKKRDRPSRPSAVEKLTKLVREDAGQRTLFLSRYWLIHLGMLGRPAPLDNGWFLCPHGFRLPPDSPRFQEASKRAIRLSVPAWRKLREYCGGGPKLAIEGDPESPGFACKRCMREVLDRRRHRERDTIVKLTERRGTPEYSISQTWLHGWRSFVKGRSDEVPGPIEGTDIVDDEGYLRPDADNAAYTNVDHDIWAYLYGIYGGDTVKLSRPRSPPPRESDQQTSGQTSPNEHQDETMGAQAPPQPRRAAEPRTSPPPRSNSSRGGSAQEELQQAPPPEPQRRQEPETMEADPPADPNSDVREDVRVRAPAPRTVNMQSPNGPA